jgi:hypothetical protein
MCIDRKREALIKNVDREFFIFFRKEGKWRALDTRNPIENEYGRALFLGDGAWWELEDISDEEGYKIIEEWRRKTKK